MASHKNGPRVTDHAFITMPHEHDELEWKQSDWSMARYMVIGYRRVKK